MIDLNFLFNGNYVKRFHALPTIEDETVGHHSHTVAALVWVLSDGKASAKELMAALLHDHPEQVIGDIPANTKKFLKTEELSKYEDTLTEDAGWVSNASLTVAERRRQKAADIFSGMLACVRELSLGNKNLSAVYGRYLSYLSEYDLCKSEPEVRVLKFIDELWRKYGGE